MADSTEELRFRAVGEDVSAGRMMKNLGDKADDAKDEIRGLDRQLSKLDEQVDLTALHMKALIHEFDETGDKSLFRDIRKDRSQLALLQSIRKELRGIGDDSEEVGRTIGPQLSKGIGETLGSIPSQLKGALIVGAVGAAVAAAPFIGAAIGGAVLGGVGGGGIIGGIALAAQDSRVQTAATELGEHLRSSLQDAAQPFVYPLLLAFDQLEVTGDKLIAQLGKGFSGLASTIGPLTRGIDGMVDALGPGLADAFEAAEPVIRLIAAELPELGDSISYALSAISEESDGAILGLSELFAIVEYGIEFTGDLVANLSALYEWIVRNADAGYEWGEKWLSWLPIAGPLLGALHTETSSMIDDLNASKSATDTYVGSVGYLANGLEEQAKAAKLARNALTELADSIKDQFDPTANLIHRLQDLREAQAAYNEAVKEHGRNSQEAKDAELAMAEAILGVNSAAAAAQGTFDGKFDPALHRILKDGGLTEAQIRDLEKQFNAARQAGEKFAKTYKAQAVLDASQLYGSLAAANNALNGSGYVSGRASGGDVEAGRTYMVGENGPELVTFGENGYVHDAASTQAMLSGSSGGSAGGWSGGGTTTVILRAIPSGNAVIDALMGMLRAEIQGQGGDVQLVLGSSTLKG